MSCVTSPFSGKAQSRKKKSDRSLQQSQQCGANSRSPGQSKQTLLSQNSGIFPHGPLGFLPSFTPGVPPHMLCGLSPMYQEQPHPQQLLCLQPIPNWDCLFKPSLLLATAIGTWGTRKLVASYVLCRFGNKAAHSYSWDNWGYPTRSAGIN